VDYMVYMVDAVAQQPYHVQQSGMPSAPQMVPGATDCAPEKYSFQQDVAPRGEQAGVKKASKLAAALKARLSLPGGDSSARQEILQRRMRTTQRWRSDNSTFSALNLDSVSSLTCAAASLKKSVRAQPVEGPQCYGQESGKKHIKRQESCATATTAAPESDGEECDNCSEDAACDQEEQQPQYNALPEEDEQEEAVSAAEMAASPTQQIAADGQEADAPPTEMTAATMLQVDASPKKHEEGNRTGEWVEQEFVAARTLLLAFRAFGGDMPPTELGSMRATSPRLLLPEGAMQNASTKVSRSSPKQRSDAKAQTPKSPSDSLLPTSAAHAYRMQAECRSKSEEIRRTVQSLLNKICPENVSTIRDRIAKINVNEVEQLEVIIELIFKKALAEPHYCETYADLVFGLKSVFPEFPSHDGGKPIAFRSSVLNICQHEFEEMMQFGPRAG